MARWMHMAVVEEATVRGTVPCKVLVLALALGTVLATALGMAPGKALEEALGTVPGHCTGEAA